VQVRRVNAGTDSENGENANDVQSQGRYAVHNQA
jgi:hypothetical protein